MNHSKPDVVCRKKTAARIGVVVLALLMMGIRALGDTPEFFAAIRSNDLVKAREILKTDASLVNARMDKGVTALHAAAELNLKDMAELLLSSGANINAKTDDGYTPLFLAISKNARGMVTLLLASAVDINRKMDDEFTPPGEEEKNNDHKWSFRVGVVHQMGARMSFRGPPATLVREVWSALPGRSGRTMIDQSAGYHPTAGNISRPADDITQYGDRTFDDGFVWEDTWTEDPLVPADRVGTTWNWGYNDISQYDAGALTLTFHRTRSINGSGLTTDIISYSQDRTTRDLLRDRDLSGSDEIAQNAIQLTAQRRLKRWKRWDLELDLNLAWFPETTTGAGDTPFEMLVHQDTYRVTERQSSTYSYATTIQETYVYGDRFGRLDPLLPPLPVSAPPPYLGGGMNGPGPLIPNLPEGYTANTLAFNSDETPQGSVRSEELVGSRSWDITDRVDMKVDLQRFRLAGGLALTHPLSKRLDISINPKLTLNIVDVDITRQETVIARDLDTGTSTIVASRQTHRNKLSMIPGLLLAVALDYHVTEHWFIGAYASYEWLLDTVDLQAEPDRVAINLDGIEFSLLLGRDF